MTVHNRCYVLSSATDASPAVVKWKSETKKHGPQACVQDTYVDVWQQGSISIDEWTVDLYQSCELNDKTELSAVFNIPLIADILIYPVFLRITGTQDLPSLGRIKKLLCEHLIRNSDQSFFPEEEEEAIDDELPSLSDDDDEPTEVVEEEDSMEESDDEMYGHEDADVEDPIDDEEEDDVMDDDDN
jgi:hypothetical protein